MTTDLTVEQLCRLTALEMMLRAMTTTPPQHPGLLSAFDALTSLVQAGAVSRGIIDQAPQEWRAAVETLRAQLLVLCEPGPPPAARPSP